MVKEKEDTILWWQILKQGQTDGKGRHRMETEGFKKNLQTGDIFAK